MIGKFRKHLETYEPHELMEMVYGIYSEAVADYDPENEDGYDEEDWLRIEYGDEFDYMEVYGELLSECFEEEELGSISYDIECKLYKLFKDYVD